MSFRKPFKAVPIKPSSYYQRTRCAANRSSALRILAIGAMVGAVAGAGSLAVTADGRATIAQAVKPVMVRFGLMRARAPQQGDYWAGCNAARAVGTAPIYSGEPGYRSEMDGDSDGIACEPYYGN